MISYLAYSVNHFSKQALVFTCLLYKSFENTMRKGEIAHEEQLLRFPTVFSTLLEKFLPFSPNLKLPSAETFSVWKPEIGCLGKC